MKNDLKANYDLDSAVKHSNTDRSAKRKLCKPLSVTKFMDITKAKGIPHFAFDSSIVTQECLPAKGIVGAILNRQLLILVTNSTISQRRIDKN